jgi:hypothetical protein
VAKVWKSKIDKYFKLNIKWWDKKEAVKNLG